MSGTRNIDRIIFVVALIGLALSAYLVYYHYDLRLNHDDWCDFGQFLNCNNVLLSPYSEIAGVPLGALGAVWFIITAVLLHFKIRRPESSASLWLFIWTLIGVASTFGLVYTELFLIGSVCILCTSSHLMGIAVFVLTWMSVRKSISSQISDFFYHK